MTLFPRASLVQGSGHPKGTEVRASYYTGAPDENEQSFNIWVELPDVSTEKKAEFGDDDSEPPDFDYLGPQDSDGFREINRQPTLRIVVEGLEVIEIGGVSYAKSSVPVEYHEGPKKLWKF